MSRAFVVLGVLGLVVAPATAFASTSSGDVPVTVDVPYVKANGAPVTEGDAIAFCGEHLRQQNEPSAAIDPRDPQVIVAGANDYCTVEGAGGTWAGYYRSTDGGAHWTNSVLPGYPTDASAEGEASPLHRLGITNAGDPVQAWDNDGRLFYMGNAFNRSAPQNASVWVATYDRDGGRYLRTRVVGRGTPAPQGRFNDKTSLEVDRGAESPFAGNVYAAWSVFQGAGNNEIYFVRSTDHGATFSHQMKISEGVKDNQFADITVTSDGTVYVTWRQFASRSGDRDAVVYVKSTDGGRSFTKPRVVTEFQPFDAADTVGDPEAAEEAREEAFANADGPESEAPTTSVGNARDCGSGPLSCESGYVFFRHDSQPRVTADPKGDPGTVYLVYDAVKPGTVEPATSTYNTTTPSGTTPMVGQGAIFFTKTTDGGATWSEPTLIDDQSKGHQLFPDINADGGYLHAVWHDSRLDPAYSVQRPPGNAAAKDAAGVHLAVPGLDTFAASSTDGGATWSVTRVSTATQMPNFEMFGDRRVPFHGDYNYVSSVGPFAYNVWTDTRQVKPGDDPRYAGGEGFDVLQCRTQNPDGSFGEDTCPNAGGLDQDIFGAATRG